MEKTPEATVWETRPLFITSTFGDMHAGRDHLAGFVFPRLREQQLRRRIHPIDVDLRRGVPEEACKDKHTIRIFSTNRRNLMTNTMIKEAV